MHGILEVSFFRPQPFKIMYPENGSQLSPRMVHECADTAQQMSDVWANVIGHCALVYTFRYRRRCASSPVLIIVCAQLSRPNATVVQQFTELTQALHDSLKQQQVRSCVRRTRLARVLDTHDDDATRSLIFVTHHTRVHPHYRCEVANCGDLESGPVALCSRW